MNEISRAQEYARRRELILGETIGFGQDGIVFATNAKTAVKAMKHPDLYAKELAVYLRLKEKEIGKLGGFSVPRLVGHRLRSLSTLRQRKSTQTPC